MKDREIIILLTGVLQVVLSQKKTWTNGMEFCLDSFPEYIPFAEHDVGKLKIEKNSWLFNARYGSLDDEIIIMQLQQVIGEEICSEENCRAVGNNCKLCETKFRLNESISSLEIIKTKMLQGKTYILGLFHEQKFPIPDLCLMYRNVALQEYRPCNESLEYTCRKINESSKSNLTIVLEFPKTTTNALTQEYSSDITTPSDEGYCEFFLQNLKSILIVCGILVLLVIINVVCVCCCVKYQVKRKLRSLNIQKMNDSTCRPISVAITRIYKTMNAFGEEQNETYDLAAHVNKSNLAITSEINDKDDYDRGFFRLVTQSGDYDMAWSNTWSSPTSPDVEYDQVQNVSALLMTCLPEDEIYSKQRLPSQDISSDLNEMCNNGKENFQECAGEMPVKTINEISRERSLDEKYSSSQTLAKIRESGHKDIDGNSDKDTQQTQTLVYVDDSGTKQKAPSLTDDKTLTENEKSRSDIKGVKNSEIREKQNTRKGVKDVNMKKVRRERKSGNVCNNSSEYPYGKILKTSLPRADKMVDEATSLLVANMNKVLSETKL